MGRLRTLIIGAGVAFLVSGVLNMGGKGDGKVDFDSLLTMAFLVYIWYTLRWAASSKNRKKDASTKPQELDSQGPEPGQKPPLDKRTEAEIFRIREMMQEKERAEGEESQPLSDQPGTNQPKAESMNDAIPNLLGSLRPDNHTIIRHKSPWAIIERGATVGRFRNAPIPAWIVTSDNRKADYNGITDDPSLEGVVCIEVPERSELILPPGLVYLLRS
ncbi:MAG: hypothetical protein HQL72_09605 [Magnetococcales bacterium]|nr:hypothetical protein [Magnetococcales bacterium]